VPASPISLTCQNRSNITTANSKIHAVNTNAVSADDLNDNGDPTRDGRPLGKR
jgi:hypothetical protein